MANGQLEAIPARSRDSLDAGMSDGELLGQFNGRRDQWAEMAFEALVGRHGPMVLRVCRQILGDKHRAEDAFQATFLVLARRSRSIRQPEFLGNWLYGVALRTAWEVRLRDGRRRQREGAIAEDARAEPASQAERPELTLIGREEIEVLHEEVSRLPETYRIPVVLCELEGLTYQEAARRLRCPVGTIGVRLKRARERLRVRMIRRGIVPAVALAHAMFGAEEAAALVPAVLAQTTIRAAAGFAASDAAAMTGISAHVFALTQAVLKLMALTRLKVATSLVLTVGITATVGWLGVHRRFHTPDVVEQGQQRTIVAAKPLENVPGPALGGPAVESAPRAPQVTASPMREAPHADRQASGAILAVSHREEVKPEARMALANARRPVMDERDRGELLFAKEWAPNDPMSHGGDGLGPVYNETSCVACHGLGGPGGAGPESKNVVILTAMTQGSQVVPKGLKRVHPGFGNTRSTVLHRFGTDPAYESWRRHLYESRPDREQAPAKDAGEDAVGDHMRKIVNQTFPGSRSIERSARLQPAPGINLNVSVRNTPALFGAGRIDAIPSAVLFAEAERQPSETRGRVSRTRAGRAGRFGWKGQIASLHEFVRGACASELGLEVPGQSQAVSPLAPTEKAKGLDLDQTECDALVAYVRALPAPVAVDPTGPQGTTDMEVGRRLFASVGCAKCHSPSLGDVRGIYSDLLLHNMGSSLSDSGSSYGIEGPDSPGGPSPGEWRTPPLWGFRDSGPYLHDGRAQTLDEAVALHGGQGAKSAREFFTLPARDRARIEAFLKSLVAPTAVSAPGLVLASELEERIEPEATRRAEALIRKQRERVAAQEEKDLREAKRRQQLAEAEEHAQRQFPLAVRLEKSGKIPGAIDYYREIVRIAPDTEEGRVAAKRLEALGSDRTRVTDPD